MNPPPNLRPLPLHAISVAGFPVSKEPLQAIEANASLSGGGGSGGSPCLSPVHPGLPVAAEASVLRGGALSPGQLHAAAENRTSPPSTWDGSTTPPRRSVFVTPLASMDLLQAETISLVNSADRGAKLPPTRPAVLPVATLTPPRGVGLSSCGVETGRTGSPTPARPTDESGWLSQNSADAALSSAAHIDHSAGSADAYACASAAGLAGAAYSPTPFGTSSPSAVRRHGLTDDVSPTQSAEEGDTSSTQQVCSPTLAAVHDATAAVVAPDAPEIALVSRLHGDFANSRLLGSGDFGDVFRAKSIMDQRRYAIKRANRSSHSQFDEQIRLQEVFALASCSSSPHVLRFHDAFIDTDASLCIVTELLDGGPARLHITGREWMEAELWDFLLQTALGLQVMHDADVAHLDIKPDNILCTRDEAYRFGTRYTIADFGLARSCASQLADHTFVGKNDDEGDCHYICPYLLNGNGRTLYVKAADIYSLGATMMHLVGSPAPMTSDYGVLRRVSKPLRDIIVRMTAENPPERPDLLLIVALAGMHASMSSRPHAVGFAQAERRNARIEHFISRAARAGGTQPPRAPASAANGQS